MSKKHGFFLKHCKVCDKDVAWSVKKCPHCGVKNPTVTLKHQLITWAALLLVIGLWLSPDKEENANLPAPVTTVTKDVVEQSSPDQAVKIEEESHLNIEQLRVDFASYQEKRKAAEDLWGTVERLLAVYESNPSISSSEELTRYMQLAEQAAQGTLFQDTPAGNKAISEAFKEMNSGLSGMFSNTGKRIRYALEISMGSKDLTKTMERYARAAEMYQYNVQEFDKGALQIEQQLKASEEPLSNPHP